MDLTFDLQRDTPFRYECHQCSRCCHNQRIHLNPYEVVRLARNRGISTAQLIAECTTESGTVLRFTSEPERADTTCVFLGDHGCGVHLDRPLACRLYPLGRHVAADGAERYAVLPGHPKSEGVFGRQGDLGPQSTVATYVSGQGVGPYYKAADRYFGVLQRLISLLNEGPPISGAQDSTWVSWNESDVAEWMDVDVAVERRCARLSLPAPEDAESAMSMHIDEIEEWVRVCEAKISSSAAARPR